MGINHGTEWKGLKFVFGGDTYPNQWFDKYARDADVAIHECFIDVPNLIEKFGFSVSNASEVGTQINTSPEAFGKVMIPAMPATQTGSQMVGHWQSVGQSTKSRIASMQCEYSRRSLVEKRGFG